MNTRNPYADACTQEAMKLVTEHGMAATQVARDLDSSLATRHRWLRAARSVADHAIHAPTPTLELARLRRENTQVRMERDIRTKALGICSRMPQCASNTPLLPAIRACTR